MENAPEISKKEKIIVLTKELSNVSEGFVFSGIESDAYANLKADEEEFPGYITPIDEIIERLQSEGMKVVFGKNPESGNVYILPMNSENIEEDSIQPKSLIIGETMDARLKELISLDRS